MDSFLIMRAIKHIRPNAEFSFIDLDYENITWHLVEGNPPSKEEIDAAIVEIQKIEAEAEAAAKAKREAALAKLEALGLDEDDLKALGF